MSLTKRDDEENFALRGGAGANHIFEEKAMSRLIAMVAVGVLSCGSIGAFGAGPPLPWPRFRGPNGAGVAGDQKPPIHVGPQTNVKWKVTCPPGLSSPIVAGDKLVITAFDGGKLYTVAYDRAT